MPELVDRRLDTFDGHLTSGSPAVDAGTPDAAPATDLDGTPRDAVPDIGAYELGSVIFRDGFESGDTGRWSASVGADLALPRLARWPPAAKSPNG